MKTLLPNSFVKFVIWLIRVQSKFSERFSSINWTSDFEPRQSVNNWTAVKRLAGNMPNNKYYLFLHKGLFGPTRKAFVLNVVRSASGSSDTEVARCILERSKVFLAQTRRIVLLSSCCQTPSIEVDWSTHELLMIIMTIQECLVDANHTKNRSWELRNSCQRWSTRSKRQRVTMVLSVWYKSIMGQRSIERTRGIFYHCLCSSQSLFNSFRPL